MVFVGNFKLDEQYLKFVCWVVHVSTFLFVCMHVYQSGLICLSMYECSCTYVCVSACECVCTCMCMNVGAEVDVRYPLLSLLTLVFEIRSLPQPWAYWLGRLARELQNSSYLKFSQVLGYTHALATTSSFLHWCGDPNSDCHSCTRNTLSNEASPPTVEES